MKDSANILNGKRSRLTNVDLVKIVDCLRAHRNWIEETHPTARAITAKVVEQTGVDIKSNSIVNIARQFGIDCCRTGARAGISELPRQVQYDVKILARALTELDGLLTQSTKDSVMEIASRPNGF